MNSDLPQEESLAKRKVDLSPGDWYFAASASEEATLTDDPGTSKFYATIEAFPSIIKPGVVPTINMSAMQTFNNTRVSES